MLVASAQRRRAWGAISRELRLLLLLLLLQPGRKRGQLPRLPPQQAFAPSNCKRVSDVPPLPDPLQIRVDHQRHIPPLAWDRWHLASSLQPVYNQREGDKLWFSFLFFFIPFVPHRPWIFFSFNYFFGPLQAQQRNCLPLGCQGESCEPQERGWQLRRVRSPGRGCPASSPRPPPARYSLLFLLLTLLSSILQTFLPLKMVKKGVRTRTK